METLLAIVQDWQAYAVASEGRPRAASLDSVLKCAADRVQTSSLGEVDKEDAYRLFSVAGTGLPPLMRMLHAFDNQRGEVYFVHFWQAMDELWRRLRAGDNLSDDEPMAEELVEFRDGLVRRLAAGAASCQWLAEELGQIEKTSADRAAWGPLQAAIEETASGDPERCLTAKDISVPLFAWLHELSDDYCRGVRGAMIRGFCDVAGCQRRTACLHLGSASWDVEAALRSFFSGKCPTALLSSSWSSQGAKMRKDEVDCPICMIEYTPQKLPMETSCCFQVMCPDCYKRLTTLDGIFSCPFCRVTAQVSLDDLNAWRSRWRISAPERGRSGSWAGGSRILRGIGRGVSRAVDVVVGGFLEVDRPR
eukprot:TRINITY_DN20343_c0_g1_i1.p1 TRINITY_DN20343_c0_g1~~TRINITY_DN20343_c0_g1_i1.p1  ORF type:complete len:364 (-),score=67.70 TRINITY_DN20343_c0_g1_i1:732-1823(-)